MSQPIRLCLVLHNHQPIGNFDGVFEQAYQDSYLPFLEVFEPFSDLRISLHTSGPLMEWLDKNHPEYLDRLKALVEYGRVEIVGGGFYEPILPMLPKRDRIGQIRAYTDWLEDRLGGDIQGAWIAERVWEQSLVSDLAEAGIRYTVLDDRHFQAAGKNIHKLYGHYLTEDQGNLLSVFPGSERLRYTIPFAPVDDTIAYLRNMAEAHPGAVAVFGDDGEKFGTWPNTKEHVYGEGWLKSFFETLVANRDWIITTTAADALANTPSQGKIYLPDCSYREMTGWALPVEQQHELEDLEHELVGHVHEEQIFKFIRGGNWRNFKVRYPETDAMYSRMMMISDRLHDASQRGHFNELIDEARQALYRGQCNCAYWHGAFGGVYLPHLRQAVYQQLIIADNLLDQAEQVTGPRIEALVSDFNFDGRREIRLANDQLVCLVAPAMGGQIYELDVRSIAQNLLATMTRRPEAYHRKVLGGPQSGEEVASIHDRVHFKQEGLDQRLGHDAYPRHSMVDHFFDTDISLEDVQAGKAMERGDFAGGDYEARIRRNPGRIQIQMIREGNAWGVPITLTKGVTMTAGSGELEIAYLLEGLPRNESYHFAPEFNFAGMPGGADDRYFFTNGPDGHQNRRGHLGTSLCERGLNDLGLTDGWLGLDVQLLFSEPTDVWAYPVETVSQSEGGFELVHQSVAVHPHWLVQGNEEGRWSASFKIAVVTSTTACDAMSLSETIEI